MAYRYAVSFELKSDDSYSERYASLMEQLNLDTTNYWDETTSVVLVKSNETIEAFEDRLYFDSLLIKEKDKLLVIDHANSSAVARGPFKYPNTLEGHFKSFVRK